MAELPTMPVRTDALLGDTTDMSATEFGAYVRILLAMWRNGGWLPNDERRLARYGTLTSGQWARSGQRIMDCLVDMGDGRITQGKLADEYEAALAVSKTASENAKSGWRKRRREENHGLKSKAVRQQPGLPSDSPNNGCEYKSLKYNGQTDAPASRPQCYPDPVSSIGEVGGVAREDPLFDRVLVAARLNPRDVLPTYWLPPMGPMHVEGWRAYGFTDDEIVTVVEGAQANRPAPPRGPKAFDDAMRRYAEWKAAPPITPVIPAPAQGDFDEGRRPASRSERSTDAWLAGARRLPG